jgi:hypothetical protein
MNQFCSRYFVYEKANFQLYCKYQKTSILWGSLRFIIQTEQFACGSKSFWNELLNETNFFTLCSNSVLTPSICKIRLWFQKIIYMQKNYTNSWCMDKNIFEVKKYLQSDCKTRSRWVFFIAMNCSYWKSYFKIAKEKKYSKNIPKSLINEFIDATKNVLCLTVFYVKNYISYKILE